MLLFGHERLAAYQVSLSFRAWFHALPGAPELSSRRFRQVDQAATSVGLNIAEGNGRALEADRGKFLTQAESWTVKAATFLDLGERTGELEGGQRENGLALLGRVAATLRGLSGNIER